MAVRGSILEDPITTKPSGFYCQRVFVWLLLLTVTVQEMHGQPDVRGIWTGTLTMKQIYTGELGKSVLEISTNFVENRGTGVMQFDAEWKAAQGIHKVTCAGRGNAELYHVNISEEDSNFSTYYIHVIGPDYTCSPPDENVPQNAKDVTVSGKVLTSNSNILSGTLTETHESGTGPVTTIYTWRLSRSSNNAQLIVTPDNYDTWLPEPGRNEFMQGSVMKVSLKLFGANGQAPTVKAKSFEVRLLNTSNEPGTTINFPLAPQDQLPDLRFLPQANTTITEEFQFAQIQSANGTTAEISIAAYDGGAYTILTAQALLEDNTRLEGHLLISGGPTEVLIPKRPANSKIGTAWLAANGDPADTDDNETSAGNTNDGDGLSAYEEYRGIIYQGEFHRLDPQVKELGVWGKRTQLPLFSDGLTWFEDASGIKILRFYETEIGNDKRLNKNAGTANIFSQYVLKLEKNSLPTNILGRTDRGPAIPARVGTIFIDIDQAAQQYREVQQLAATNNIQMPYTFGELVAKTVGHEVGHGVNIKHHGQGTAVDLNATVSVPNPQLHIYMNGNELTDPAYHLEGLAGKAREQASGDIFCMINYLPGYDWAIKEVNNVFYLYYVPLQSIGKLLCNSSAGTDFNSTPDFFGDATEGNCLGQIKLK